MKEKKRKENDIVRVNKFNDLQKLYLQTIISVYCQTHYNGLYVSGNVCVEEIVT